VDAKGKVKGDIQNEEEEGEDQQKKEEREAIARFAWTRQGREEQEAVCRDMNEIKRNSQAQANMRARKKSLFQQQKCCLYIHKEANERRGPQRRCEVRGVSSSNSSSSRRSSSRNKTKTSNSKATNKGRSAQQNDAATLLAGGVRKLALYSLLIRCVFSFFSSRFLSSPSGSFSSSSSTLHTAAASLSGSVNHFSAAFSFLAFPCCCWCCIVVALLIHSSHPGRLESPRFELGLLNNPPPFDHTFVLSCSLNHFLSFSSVGPTHTHTRAILSRKRKRKITFCCHDRRFFFTLHPLINSALCPPPPPSLPPCLTSSFLLYCSRCSF